MQIFGFTINLLTLLAIVLSVGLVVDDAIVVVENVERHLREGLSPINAALLGARELIGPIIAMTITLAAVYVPIGIQGGLTGTLFREFAFTLAGAVTISGVVALTLSPMMSAQLLRASAEEHGFAGKVNRTFDRIREGYGRILDRTLQMRPAIYVAWIGLSILAVLLLKFSISMNSELAPTEDQGVIFGIVDAPANATIEQTSAFADAAGKIFLGFPETNFTFQLTFPSSGFGGMVFKPWGKRKETPFQLLPKVQKELGTIPGIQMFPVMPPALPGGGQFPVEFVILSTAEPEQVLGFAKQLQLAAMKSGKFAFPPIIDTKIDQPQSEIVIDHDKTAALGLDLQQVGADLSAMMGGNFVNRFDIAGRAYKVIPQIKRVDRLNPKQLEQIYVTGPDGKLIQLSTIATIRNKVIPRSLNRLQQLNAIKISGVSIVPIDQALARARHPGLQGADRAAAEGGRLLVREAAGAHQDERLARLRAELPQRRRQFLQGERGFGIVDRGQRRCRLVVDRCRAAACRAQIGVEAVAHDGEQPALEIRAGGELGLLVERREDGVLDEIVGCLALAAKEARKGAEVRKQPDDVVLNHRVEGSRGAVNFGTFASLCGQSMWLDAGAKGFLRGNRAREPRVAKALHACNSS